MKWTPEMDSRLLLSVITALSPCPPNWNKVAELMQNDTTAESVRQRYQALRKTAGKNLGASTTGDKTDNTPSATPEAATPRKRVKKAAGDGKNPQEVDESPSKRIKKEEKVSEEPEVI